MFSDLRDYTRFVESRGDAEAAALLRDYRTLVRREVGRHTGAEVKTEGDSFYVVFTSPTAALRCAVAILRRARDHTAAHPDRPLNIGIGLHAGETVEFDDQFVGSAVNVGARLASKASGGELLVSDTFRGLVRTATDHEMSDRGPLRLKGVAERIRAWRVELGPPLLKARRGRPEEEPAAEPAFPLPTAVVATAVGAQELLSPVLVGRSAELASADGLIASAVGGEGGLVLVSGEAGVGKTALLRELQRRAAAERFRLLPGRTAESDAGLPYAPFIAALRAGYQDGPPGQLRKVLDRLAPDLVALFPELGPARNQGGGSTVERHRVVVAFSTLLAALAGSVPILLCLEDLHWADEASLALIQQLTREVRRSRILIVGTYRSDELQRLHPLLRVVAALRRDRSLHEIELGRLSRDETIELIEAATQGRPPLAADVADAIYRRAQGNPFFTEELLHSIADAERSGKTLPIPATVRDAVRARLGNTAPGTRSTIAAASVIGERFEFDLLRRIRGLDEMALADELRECIDQLLLVELDDPVTPTYAFRHALTREVVYSEMLLPERRRLHLLAAQALASEPRSAAATLAEHWRLGGNAERAAEAYERAAQSALSMFAPAEAVAQVERAIEMRATPSLEHYELLAQAYLFFDPVKAREAAEGGLELMPEAEPAVRRVRLMRQAGRARRALGETAGNVEHALEGWELAERSGDAAARANAADWVAQVELLAGDLKRAGEWAERAISGARESGELAIEGNALVTLAAASPASKPRTALRILDDAAAIARRTASAQVMARLHETGVARSFAAERERPRVIRLERALEFTRRYGMEPDRLRVWQLLHDVQALRWPDTPRPRGDDEDPTSEWEDLLWDVMAVMRRGPAAASGAGPARDPNELPGSDPGWRVAWHALLGLRAALSGDVAARGDGYRRMREASPPDAAWLGLGLNASAMLAFLERDTDTLERLDRALADAEGSEGQREMLAAFQAALSGDDPSEPFARAASSFRERGLALNLAIDLWALASVSRLGQSWSTAVDRGARELSRCGATWLVAETRRLVG